MSKDLVVNGITYKYPISGDDPGWGEEASDWAEAVTDLLSTFINAGDIIESSISLVNNQTTFIDVIGLSFDPATVRAASIFYSVYITTDSNEVIEAGEMTAAYKDVAGEWVYSQDFIGDAGIEFQITNGGQVQYKTSDITGTNYNSLMKFRAKTTLTTV